MKNVKKKVTAIPAGEKQEGQPSAPSARIQQFKNLRPPDPDYDPKRGIWIRELKNALRLPAKIYDELVQGKSEKAIEDALLKYESQLGAENERTILQIAELVAEKKQDDPHGIREFRRIANWKLDQARQKGLYAYNQKLKWILRDLEDL